MLCFKTGSTTLLIWLQFPAADIITVPGEITSSFGYFCFIDNESLPVGTLIPNSIENFEIASTASYSRASSPSFLHGHIQFADKDTLFKFSFSGAQTIFVSASVIAFLLPALGSIKAAIGEWPIDVATPSFPLKSNAITPTLLRGIWRDPTHCCLATLPPTHLSTLFVNQSLQATASNWMTWVK